MRKTTLFLTLALAAGGATILSASRDPGTQPTRDAGQPVTVLRSPTQIQADQRAPSTHEGTAPEATQTSRAPAYTMRRFSVHTGGSASAASANLRSGVFVGETVLGRASSQSFRANVGFWFGVAGPVACPITLPGDVQQNGEITSGDIIYMVNFVFKAGPEPLPCVGAGDMNCSGGISPADIIYLVNNVFKAGPEPCDMCTLIPSVWTCP